LVWLSPFHRAGEHPADVTDHFRYLARQAGLPPVRLHYLRHGAAALALAAGVDMRIGQATLRHSSFIISADTYTSVLPELARGAAEKTAGHRAPTRTAGGRSPRGHRKLRSIPSAIASFPSSWPTMAGLNREGGRARWPSLSLNCVSYFSDPATYAPTRDAPSG
jgi:hypothetical protein